MRPERVAVWNDLQPLEPAHALIGDVDLVVVRWEDAENVSVLYGRCLHRDALLADGHIRGRNLVCGVHNWDYRYRTGVSEYHNDEILQKFDAWVEDDAVWVDADDVAAWAGARACGHSHLRDFNVDDLTTAGRETAELAGIPFAGVADWGGDAEGSFTLPSKHERRNRRSR